MARTMNQVLSFTLVGLVLLSCLGCVELLRIVGDLPGGGRADGGGDSPIAPHDEDPDLQTGLPVVRIETSNLVPAPFEEMILSCSLVEGSEEDLVFSFEPDDRLVVDEQAGEARILIEEGDVAATLIFTCTGTNSVGVGEPSEPIVIVPS